MLQTKILISDEVKIILEKKPNHEECYSPLLTSVFNLKPNKNQSLNILLIDPMREFYQIIKTYIRYPPKKSDYVSSGMYYLKKIHIEQIVDNIKVYKNDFDLLLFDFSWEAVNSKFGEYFLKYFKHKYPNFTKVIFVCGSCNHPNNYIDFYSDSFFESWSYVNLKHRPLTNNTTEKLKRFISLNRKQRPLRLQFIEELYKHNLVENFLLSHPAFNNYQERILDVPIYFQLPEIKEIQWFEGGLHPDIDFQWVNYNLFNKSYINVITESLIESETNTVFITEKIFKSIYAKIPFIIYNAAGTLEALRQLGYKTYEGIFDESYDKEPSDLKRLDLIIKEIKRLSELSDNEFLQLYEKTVAITQWNNENYIKRNENKVLGIKFVDYLYEQCYNI